MTKEPKRACPQCDQSMTRRDVAGEDGTVETWWVCPRCGRQKPKVYPDWMK